MELYTNTDTSHGKSFASQRSVLFELSLKLIECVCEKRNKLNVKYKKNIFFRVIIESQLVNLFLSAS